MACALAGGSPLSLAADEPESLRPPKQGGVYVIAHRGAHMQIPENTLAAYARAIDLGADFVEIDLRTTKDDHFVSIHNSTIDAYVTDGRHDRVRNLTLAQLQALDIGSRVDKKWNSERIPTLQEILKLCKGRIGIYLDLKSAPVSEVAEIILEYEMEREVVWCVHPGKVASIRAACPECIPMPDPVSEQSLPAMLQATTPTIVAPVWNDFSNTFSATCHDAGALVFVDERTSSVANWKLALDWGADGIQTDDPEGLIDFLKKRQ